MVIIYNDPLIIILLLDHYHSLESSQMETW